MPKKLAARVSGKKQSGRQPAAETGSRHPEPRVIAAAKTSSPTDKTPTTTPSISPPTMPHGSVPEPSIAPVADPAEEQDGADERVAGGCGRPGALDAGVQRLERAAQGANAIVAPHDMARIEPLEPYTYTTLGLVGSCETRCPLPESSGAILRRGDTLGADDALEASSCTVYASCIVGHRWSALRRSRAPSARPPSATSSCGVTARTTRAGQGLTAGGLRGARRRHRARGRCACRRRRRPRTSRCSSTTAAICSRAGRAAGEPLSFVASMTALPTPPIDVARRHWRSARRRSSTSRRATRDRARHPADLSAFRLRGLLARGHRGDLPGAAEAPAPNGRSIVAFVIETSPAFSNLTAHSAWRMCLKDSRRSLWVVELQQSKSPSTSLEARERARVIGDVTDLERRRRHTNVLQAGPDKGVRGCSRRASSSRYDVTYGRPDVARAPVAARRRNARSQAPGQRRRGGLVHDHARALHRRAAASSAAVGAVTAAAQVFRSGIDTVLLNVTVTDCKNRPLTGLDRDDFRVFEDGIAQEISVFASDPQPIALSLLLDSSTSMEDKLAVAQEAAVGFAHRLGPRDVAQVIDFNSETRIRQPFTSDVRALEKSHPRDPAPADRRRSTRRSTCAIHELKRIRRRDRQTRNSAPGHRGALGRRGYDQPEDLR